MTRCRRPQDSAAAKRSGWRLLPILCLVLPWVGVDLDAAASELVIRNVHLPGASSTAEVWIRDGRIAALGPAAGEAADEDAVQLDAEGGYLSPGLIDSHVHLAVVPGSALRNDPPPVLAEERRSALRSYLANGITTVLDTGIDPISLAQLRELIATGTPAPEVLTLGPGFLTPGGYLSDVAPDSGVATPADVEAHFRRIEGLGLAGIKVPLEEGFGPSEVWPIHGEEVRKAITIGARRRQLPIYVHGTSEYEQSLGLDMGADVLVHVGFADATPSDEFIARLAASGTYVITTFGIFDANLIRFEPERLDVQAIEMTVSPRQRATARDPESGEKLALVQAAMSAPTAPEFVQRLIAWLFIGEGGIRDSLASTLAAARRMHAAGVPLVVGSDSGNWATVPYQFHGPTTLRELELLAEIGLSPAEVQAAATRTPARMLGLEDELGEIAVGRRADLLILGSDPLKSVEAYRNLKVTIREGVARTPEEWMAADQMR